MGDTSGEEGLTPNSPTLRRVNLDKDWFLQQVDGKSRYSVPSVPTDVYRVLLAHNKIADPAKDLNELSVRWVADKDWRYTTKFKIDQQALRDGATVGLVLEGLDTFATVRLDGLVILESDNMFLSHRLNIANILTEDESHEYELEIVFASARLRGQEIVEKNKHQHRFIARQTEHSRIPVRKAQYHWGWDWGPILTGTSGPWRPVFLEYYIAKIDDLWAEYTLDDEKCMVRLYCRTTSTTDKCKLRLSISDEDGKPCGWKEEDFGDELYDCSFEITSPELWYPFSHGPQTRYKLSAVLVRHGVVLHQVSKLIGFRKVELVQQSDVRGKSFHFRVNGIDVFAGGSCWIPASNHLSALTRKNYYDWITLLKEGNQNMVRVWGGGIYEDDAFYDACDEMGILVWQDFCFACGNYPTYPSFRSSVEEEARQNVRRLRSHPSLVLWAGSNEDYQVQERYNLEYNYEDKDPDSWLKTDFPARYYYEYLLPKIVAEEHKGATYHPTSPWGDGKRTDNPKFGDLHQWDIWHGTMTKYQYSKNLWGRFVSEFGMVAYPHLETIRGAVTQPNQQHPGSVSMDFHNKAIGHERRLVSYITENFQLRHDLASFIHLSQIVQAEAMAYAYKEWRKLWGPDQPDLHRQCGGVLVWQLNDCWPTISWGVVDHHRIKKPAYYSIKRALEPCAIAISRTCRDWSQTNMNPMLDIGHVDPTLEAREGSDCEIWIASSRQEAMVVDVKIRFVSIKTGEDIIPAIHKQLQAEANTTTGVLNSRWCLTDDRDLLNPNMPFDLDKYDPYIVHATLKEGDEDEEDKVLSSDTAWPQPIKYLDFSDRDIEFEAAQSTDGVLMIWITANKPVKALVFEERQGMEISDNNFDIVPREPKTIVKVRGAGASEIRYTYIGAPSGSMALSSSSIRCFKARMSR